MKVKKEFTDAQEEVYFDIRRRLIRVKGQNVDKCFSIEYCLDRLLESLLEEKIRAASKMFEELGYEVTDDYDEVLRYHNKTRYRDVAFYKSDRSYLVSDTICGEPFAISFELNKAINKQLEELGWLDEKEN